MTSAEAGEGREPKILPKEKGYVDLGGVLKYRKCSLRHLWMGHWVIKDSVKVLIHLVCNGVIFFSTLQENGSVCSTSDGGTKRTPT